MMLKNTKEIFEILSRGGFISHNSTDERRRRYYDLLEEDEQQYAEYYSGIGFILEGGNGYYYFSRSEPRQVVQDKVERLAEFIDIVEFLKTYDPTFGVGYEFIRSDLQARMASDIELREKAERLYRDKHNHQEIVDKLIDRMRNLGFIELLSEVDASYRVTSAFNYIEELINMISVAEEVKDEIPE